MSEEQEELEAPTDVGSVSKPGPGTIAMGLAKEAKDTAEDRADKSDDRLYVEMQEQRNAFKQLYKDERSRSAWLQRFIIFMVVFLLVMLGVAVGLVKTGNVSMFGFGSVEVGSIEEEP